jgi:hypothetical protein
MKNKFVMIATVLMFMFLGTATNAQIVSSDKLAKTLGIMAEDWLSGEAIPEKKRLELFEKHYDEETMRAFARAIYEGLHHRGIEESNPKFDKYVAIMVATIWQQSKMQIKALSAWGKPGERKGEDVGAYQLRRRWAKPIWQSVYGDSEKYPPDWDSETIALTDLNIASPLWAEHMLRSEKTCTTYLKRATPEKMTTKDGGPFRYCRSVWYEGGKRKECSKTRRCYMTKRWFGIAVTNGNPMTLKMWYEKYRRAQKKVLDRVSIL